MKPGLKKTARRGVACKNLNRKFIGIELDEQYFKTAENRIKGSLL